MAALATFTLPALKRSYDTSYSKELVIRPTVFILNAASVPEVGFVVEETRAPADPPIAPAIAPSYHSPPLCCAQIAPSTAL